MSNKNRKLKKKQINKDKKSDKVGLIIAIIVGVATIIGTIVSVIAYVFPRSGEQIINQSNVNGHNIVAKEDATVNIYDHTIDLNYSNSKYEEGQELYKQAKYDEALECFSKALEYHEKNHHVDSDTAKIQSAIGLTNKSLGSYDDSIKSYTRAIGIQKSIKGDEYVLGYYYYLRATVFSENHQLKKAENDLDESEKLLKSSDPEVGTEILYSEASIDELKGVIRFQSAYSEHSDFDVGEVLGYTFIDSYYYFCKALDYKNKVGLTSQNNLNSLPISTSESEINIGDKEIAEIMVNRATVLLCMQKYEASIKDCENALEIYDTYPNEPTDHVRDAYFILATSKQYQYYLVSGGSDSDDEINNEYYNLMKKALDWSIEWTGDSFETAKSYECLGMAAMIKEDYYESLELFEKAKEIHERNGSDQGDVDIFISKIKMIIEEGEATSVPGSYDGFVYTTVQWTN